MNAKIALVLCGALLASSCATPPENIIETHYRAVLPPKAMYKCPRPRRIVDTTKLTDVDVGKYIIDLYGDILICRNSLKAIKTFESDADKELSAPSK